MGGLDTFFSKEFMDSLSGNGEVEGELSHRNEIIAVFGYDGCLVLWC